MFKNVIRGDLSLLEGLDHCCMDRVSAYNKGISQMINTLM